MSTRTGSPPQTIRQKSATMKEMPSVTSTCAICWPGNWRSRKRSITVPKTATSTIAISTATQKLKVRLKIAAGEGRAEIGAEHEQGAVRQVGNAHQAEDQREARRQQEQQAAEGDAVDRQQQPEGHMRVFRSCPGRSSDPPRCCSFALSAEAHAKAESGTQSDSLPLQTSSTCGRARAGRGRSGYGMSGPAESSPDQHFFNGG